SPPWELSDPTATRPPRPVVRTSTRWICWSPGPPRACVGSVARLHEAPLSFEIHTAASLAPEELSDPTATTPTGVPRSRLMTWLPTPPSAEAWAEETLVQFRPSP